MRGRLVLYRDQWGQSIFAHTVRELRDLAGGGKVSKMYIDTKDGRTKHIGYVVGRRWFHAFIPFEAES